MLGIPITLVRLSGIPWLGQISEFNIGANDGIRLFLLLGRANLADPRIEIMMELLVDCMIRDGWRKLF